MEIKTKKKIAWASTIVLLVMTAIMLIQSFFEYQIIKERHYFAYAFFYNVLIIVLIDEISKEHKKQNNKSVSNTET
jgi:cell division protein FtsW (lipid II flippase)